MKCAYCGGNDADTPCAYPGDNKPGCLRDVRTRAEAPERTAAIAAAIADERAAADELIGAMREKIVRLKRLAPLCEEHGSGNGARSGCPYCDMIKLCHALSEIDYLCGEPNEMHVSGYDIHCDEDAVVAHVLKRTAELCRAIKVLEALGHPRSAIYIWLASDGGMQHLTGRATS